MNRIKLSIWFLTALGFISSCKKKEMNMDKSINVDYPAAYVVNGEDASISIINLTTGEVGATVSIMGSNNDMAMWPHHISSHMNHLAVGVPGMDLSEGHFANSNMGMGGKLLVLDAQKGTIIKTIKLPSMNHNAIYSPDGSEIWIPQMDMDGKVLVYNAENYSLTSTIAVGKMPAELTFSFDGSKAYVANGDDDNVSVIDVTSKSVISVIPVGDNPVGAWTGKDNKMYVDNEDGQSISVIDVSTNKVIQTIPLGFMPGMVAHNQVKNELWVSDPMNSKIHYYSWNSGTWIPNGTLSTGLGAHAIAFTSDGATAYITNQMAHTVSVVDVNTHAVTKSIPVGKKPNGLVIRM